jgi:uncharacterized protein YciI
MTQQLQTQKEDKLWVLVSAMKENTTDYDLDRISPSVSRLIDSWNAKGKFVLSGPFNDKKTGMAVFQGTKEEANSFFEENKKVTSDVLESYLYEWGALPILSIF